jgi:hypothetical protein
MKFPLLVLLSIAHAEREGPSLQSNRDLGWATAGKKFIASLSEPAKQQQVKKWADIAEDAADAAATVTEIAMEDNPPTNPPLDDYVGKCSNETHACTNCYCSCDDGGECGCGLTDDSSCRPQIHRTVLSCIIPSDNSNYNYDRVCSLCHEDKDGNIVSAENCGPVQCSRWIDGTQSHKCTGCSYDDQSGLTRVDRFCHSLYREIASSGPLIDHNLQYTIDYYEWAYDASAPTWSSCLMKGDSPIIPGAWFASKTPMKALNNLPYMGFVFASTQSFFIVKDPTKLTYLGSFDGIQDGIAYYSGGEYCPGMYTGSGGSVAYQEDCSRPHKSVSLEKIGPCYTKMTVWVCYCDSTQLSAQLGDGSGEKDSEIISGSIGALVFIAIILYGLKRMICEEKKEGEADKEVKDKEEGEADNEVKS